MRIAGLNRCTFLDLEILISVGPLKNDIWQSSCNAFGGIYVMFCNAGGVELESLYEVFYVDCR